MKPRVEHVSQVEVLAKKKNRFRERRKGVGEGCELLELVRVLSDFRDVTVQGITRAWGMAAEYGSEVELREVLSGTELHKSGRLAG